MSKEVLKDEFDEFISNYALEDISIKTYYDEENKYYIYYFREEIAIIVLYVDFLILEEGENTIIKEDIQKHYFINS